MAWNPRAQITRSNKNSGFMQVCCGVRLVTGLQTNELGGTLRTGAAQGCQGSPSCRQNTPNPVFPLLHTDDASGQCYRKQPTWYGSPVLCN